MNTKLKHMLERPIKTILDIRVCFDYCSNLDDIKEVIKRIPNKFGEFEVLMTSEKENYFMIQNFYESKGELKSQIASYDFYNVKEEYYYDHR